ncbi:hypothetical protein SAMN05216360_110199 [Methylobacterium phyllostachyos]|uniref:Uncharacterized protein n=1 Tax=Methylobacterium phyllostachyos TaxID=582672 RepID=A0A1H0DKE4_9HYPH|nr:hypothetical protein [Methylobacterium phyllostachyos]SDN70528.1 hypothetical protein SAMN05216360_110199 [Methylobacterium phyllostachyos]
MPHALSTALAAVPPLAVRVAGARVILTGPVAGQLGREPNLSTFLHRCLRLDRLERVCFDLAAARIELRFGAAIAAGAGLRDLARVMRDAEPRAALRSSAFTRHVGERVWDEPVTLWRSGRLLSTWRLQHLGGDRIRLSHGLLRDPAALAFVAAYLDRSGAVTAIDGSSARIGFLDIRCDPGDPHGLLRLVTEAEAIESVLRRRADAPFTNPEGRGLLLNANLALAVGAAAFPPLLPASAVILAVASWPAARQAWGQLRQRRADVTTVLTILSALALLNGDHIPAALMLWLFRAWDRLTRATLRRTELRLFERLAATTQDPHAKDPRTLHGAAEAAVSIFATEPRSRAATAFANASTPLMLCVGASALFTGGTPLAQAVLRPDFFSPVLVHRRIAAAELALHLAEQGIVVRDFGALLAIREADEILLDDSVAWDASSLTSGTFGSRMAALGLRETVLFRSGREDDAQDAASRLGATRHFVRSAVHTPASYLAQQRFLGHRIIHVHAVHGADPHARSDVPVAVGPAVLAAGATAPIGLAAPDLERLCAIVERVRATQGEETAVKRMTVAVNAALIGACVYAGLSATGVVVIGTAATAGLWLGLEGRLGRTARRHPGLREVQAHAAPVPGQGALGAAA